jgi:hypothetical protein
VPIHFKDDPSLGMWVASMCNRRDEFNSDRHSRLATIGFVWNPFDQQWEEMVSKLEDYRQGHGDCPVPQCYPKRTPSLDYRS